MVVHTCNPTYSEADDRIMVRGWPGKTRDPIWIIELKAKGLEVYLRW
jgi:hypothetical protein